MKRREFMRATAGGLALAAGSSAWSRLAKAAPYGAVPEEYTNLVIPKGVQAHNILEVFMYGGVSPWETFYCQPEWGVNQNLFMHTFRPPGQTPDNNGVADRLQLALQRCAYEYDPDNLGTYFADDTDGKAVFLGPYLSPLLARDDVVKRMRVVINRHALEPHEAAIPYAISGKTLGSPSLAALGAHIARHFVETDITGRTAPYAYGFATAGGFIPNDNVLSLVANGLHPGASRPLLIKVDNVSRLNELLDRVAVGSPDDRARYDALLSAYFNKYEERLRFGNTNAWARTKGFNEILQASRSVEGSQVLQSLFDPALFVQEPDVACERANDTKNVPKMSLNIATHLLTHPEAPARHCCVIDTGITEADGGGGYDTHSEMPLTQAANLNNLLVNLLEKINKPGENNPSKIDLDKTMIILNQEFGRTPYRQGSGNGRNHWPYGYMQVYIGGPIREAQSGIYGSIDEEGQATTFTTPTENRIAALLAMGIWPFDQAGFSNSEVQGQSTDAGAVKDVTKRILGYDV